ncbi:MAG: twin arginine-targeting protein translocase TatC [Bdellovibrionales bacterium GWA2_49_15]|nr:MAG: twin arginine-targeting protein translocase TatC [Bdellovibrionales bacterium GWA2_49_15]
MNHKSLIENLEIFRKALIRVLIIVGIAFMVAYALSDGLAEIILSPLRGALKAHITQLGGGGRIVYVGLLDKVLAQLNLGLWCGVIISSPVWFYEIWRAVRTLLNDFQIKMIRPFLVFGLLLFWGGVYFAYYIVFPFSFQMLLEFGVSDITANISLRDYLSLAVKIMLFFGLAFQMPNIIVILSFAGVATKERLQSSRRYIYVILSLLAAIFSPPDVFSMMVVWVPMVLLFEVGTWIVILFIHPYLIRRSK